MFVCLVHSFTHNSRDPVSQSIPDMDPSPKQARQKVGGPRTGNNRDWVWGQEAWGVGGGKGRVRTRVNKHLRL